MRLTLDRNDVKGALRTAGALLLGNSIIVPVITGGKNPHWWILFVIGFILIVIGSTKKESI